MNLKLRVVSDGLQQVLIQDISDAPAGVSRVIWDLEIPFKKRIELNGFTEIKPYNFVNPFFNSLLAIKAEDLDLKLLAPGPYSGIYSVHYPAHLVADGEVGDNMLRASKILDRIGDLEWVFVRDTYYKIEREHSQRDALFLHKPLESPVETLEVVERQEATLLFLEGYRSILASRFKELGGENADVGKLQKQIEAIVLMLGMRENAEIGLVKRVVEQHKYMLKLLAQC